MNELEHDERISEFPYGIFGKKHPSFDEGWFSLNGLGLQNPNPAAWMSFIGDLYLLLVVAPFTVLIASLIGAFTIACAVVLMASFAACFFKFGFWGFSQLGVAVFGIILLWTMRRAGIHARKIKGRKLTADLVWTGLCGALLGVSLVASAACFHSLEFVRLPFSGDWSRWTEISKEFYALKSHGTNLLILKEVVDNGFDFALRGASISVFIYLTILDVAKSHRKKRLQSAAGQTN